MSCKKCNHIVDVNPSEGPYTTKECTSCGREMLMRRPGKHGIGLNIEVGEKFTIPSEWLRLSANPLKSRGHLTQSGLTWFAKLVFVGDIAERKGDFGAALSEMAEYYDKEFKKIAASHGIDGESDEGIAKLFSIYQNKSTQEEWWVLLICAAISGVQESIKANDTELAAFWMAIAERCKAVHIFKRDFADVVFMGHSAKRLVDLLNIWTQNSNVDDEEYWQVHFQNNPFALSQIFASPVTLIKEKAYVGGQQVDRQNAKFVDFLCAGGSNSEAILIEIKKPTTSLLQKSSYRGVLPPSRELTGSVVQAANYRRIFMEDMRTVVKGTDINIESINPRAVVIIGNSKELNTNEKIRSFELFRKSFLGVEIITFDEVFKKLEYLASVFNLTKQ